MKEPIKRIDVPVEVCGTAAMEKIRQEYKNAEEEERNKVKKNMEKGILSDNEENALMDRLEENIRNRSLKYKETHPRDLSAKLMEELETDDAPLMEEPEDNKNNYHPAEPHNDPDFYVNNPNPEKPTPDNKNSYEYVNHPSHYNQFSYETIEMMESIYGIEDTIKWCEMTAFKYKMRAGAKPGEDIKKDIDKANWYLNKKGELETKLKAMQEPF